MRLTAVMVAYSRTSVALQIAKIRKNIMHKSNHTLSIALAAANTLGLRFVKSRELLCGRKAYRLEGAAAHGLECNKRGYSTTLFTADTITQFAGAKS